MLLGDLPAALRGRAPLERTIVLNVAASWFALGPALVLYFANTEAPRWSDLWIYACALLAQFVMDYVTTLLLQRAAVGAVSVRNHLRTIADAASYDLLLAPVGLLAAFPAHAHPVVMLLLLPVLVIVQRIGSEREARHTNELELKTAYQGTSYLLGDMIEADDEYTGAHSREVVSLVLEVSNRLGLGPEELRVAEFTALLHDVGKVKVPASIINKPGPLDPDERAVMQAHTVLGEEMLEPIGGLLGRVGRIVRSCHERWDGAGYPDGLAGAEIPLVARIVCACDAWSAMTADRPYRPALPRETAARELRAGIGTQFDPDVVAALEAALGL
jgi:HD-GYP domain-containing protein (c-di-GMP phosphodiesterase class II)